MTARDRTVLLIVGALVMIAASWFLLLSPVRKDNAALDAKVAAAQARVTAAKGLAAEGARAKSAYAADYATVSRLGKAVPADDDIPSLVVQLDGAAKSARVDFRSLALAAGTGAPTPAATTAAAVASVATTPGAAATGTTAATGATGATGPAGPVAATQAAAATLPPGAVVGTAGFPTMPLDLAFTGSFFRLQDLLARLDRFTRVRDERIDVRGRLLTVDGFSLAASPKGFPNMQASVRATAYLLPSGEGLTGAADPKAPAGTAALTAPTADATGASTK